MRRRTCAGAAVVVAAALTGTALAQPSRPSVAADRPVPRADANSKLAHAQLLEKARSGGIDLYFLGDSITRRWGATDYPEFLSHWRARFHGWHAANFGWGGDTTQNILWRLENGELDGVHPKVVVLLAGTNNVGATMPPEGDEEKAADIARGLGAIVRMIRTKAPGATILLMGVFPRNDNIEVMSTIRKINARLATLADGRQVRFLDITNRLADANGRLRPGMSPDGLHLSVAGYQVWADALEPYLTQLLGPRAAEDRAPPPTGDPSAATSAR